MAFEARPPGAGPQGQGLRIPLSANGAIRDGFARLRPQRDFDGLAAAALGRSRADWLVGMNLSRAYGLACDAQLSVGRAPDLSGVALRHALAKTRDFAAVTGTISIDAERNAVKPAVVLAVEKGKFRFIRTEQPDTTR